MKIAENRGLRHTLSILPQELGCTVNTEKRWVPMYHPSTVRSHRKTAGHASGTGEEKQLSHASSSVPFSEQRLLLELTSDPAALLWWQRRWLPTPGSTCQASDL
eukprot:753264-Hanusia_phi.AAC.2